MEVDRVMLKGGASLGVVAVPGTEAGVETTIFGSGFMFCQSGAKSQGFVSNHACTSAFSSCQRSGAGVAAGANA